MIGFNPSKSRLDILDYGSAHKYLDYLEDIITEGEWRLSSKIFGTVLKAPNGDIVYSVIDSEVDMGVLTEMYNAIISYEREEAAAARKESINKKIQTTWTKLLASYKEGSEEE